MKTAEQWNKEWYLGEGEGAISLVKQIQADVIRHIARIYWWDDIDNFYETLHKMADELD